MFLRCKTRPPKAAVFLADDRAVGDEERGIHSKRRLIGDFGPSTARHAYFPSFSPIKDARTFVATITSRVCRPSLYLWTIGCRVSIASAVLRCLWSSWARLVAERSPQFLAPC